ncbi:hypothetical protein GE107_15370 [Cohnella sp. CFH 77786]|uniref:hypothetical protein n=1 Tax=Cohnella sp. CFH 77786 TaxID=2662265 RepID=UPI001C60C018|nr:hypothetical protein [Cohnella sp. CFH 77786]MBW5447437.1 hypothetical protein [Cohnella sp. CFH 77786]
MKEALKVDLTGNVVDVELVADDAPDITERYEPDPENSEELILVGYLVAKKPPEEVQIYKHKWDFEAEEWTEALTPEEIDAIKNTPTPKSPIEIRADQLDVRTLGMQDVQDFTLQQITTIEERTQGMKGIDDYTLELVLVLQETVNSQVATIEQQAAAIADLTARITTLEGGV